MGGKAQLRTDARFTVAGVREELLPRDPMIPHEVAVLREPSAGIEYWTGEWCFRSGQRNAGPGAQAMPPAETQLSSAAIKERNRITLAEQAVEALETCMPGNHPMWDTVCSRLYKLCRVTFTDVISTSLISPAEAAMQAQELVMPTVKQFLPVDEILNLSLHLKTHTVTGAIVPKRLLFTPNQTPSGV